jgi:hypothetical protein
MHRHWHQVKEVLETQEVREVQVNASSTASGKMKRWRVYINSCHGGSGSGNAILGKPFESAKDAAGRYRLESHTVDCMETNERLVVRLLLVTNKQVLVAMLLSV